MNLLLICVTFIPIVLTNPQKTTPDLVDFEFDGVAANNGDFSDTVLKSDGIDRIDVNWDGDAADDDEGNAFDAKEQRVRNSLVRATKDSNYIKKFAQILPIMRTLTKQQRLVLAALISAQTSARSNENVMNFSQVSGFYLGKIINSTTLKRMYKIHYSDKKCSNCKVSSLMSHVRREFNLIDYVSKLYNSYEISSIPK